MDAVDPLPRADGVPATRVLTTWRVTLPVPSHASGPAIASALDHLAYLGARLDSTTSPPGLIVVVRADTYEHAARYAADRVGAVLNPGPSE